MIYFTLAYEFFKIGLFSIGGGMATLPFLMDLAGKHDWFTIAQVADMASIRRNSRCTDCYSCTYRSGADHYYTNRKIPGKFQ